MTAPIAVTVAPGGVTSVSVGEAAGPAGPVGPQGPQGPAGGVTSVVGQAGAVTGAQIAADPAVRAAFGRVFSFEAYGAKGDGTADDTAAITAALAAGAGQYVIGRPGAAYVVNSRFSPAAGTRIDGRGSTLKIGAAPTGTMATADNVFYLAADDVIVENFTFGPRISGANVNDDIAATISIDVGADRGTVQNCRWRNSTVTGIRNAGHETQILGNDLDGSGIVYSIGGASRVLCARNIVRNAPAGGGLSNGLSGVGNGAGPSDNNRVIDNVIVNPLRMGIEDQQNTRNTIIRGNVVTGAVGQGISVNGAHPLVDGNTVIDASASIGGAAIELASCSGRCTNNRIVYQDVTPALATPAISADGNDLGQPTNAFATGVVILGNEIVGAGIGVFLVNYTGPVLIEGNIFEDVLKSGVEGGSGSGPGGHVIRGNAFRFTKLPPASGLFRDGIVLYGAASAGALIEGNIVTWAAGTWLTGHADTFARIQVTDCIVSGNRFDNGGRSGTVAEFSTGGVTVDRMAILGNSFRGGASLNTANITTLVSANNLT